MAEQHKTDNALKELRQWHPMADEIKQVDVASDNLFGIKLNLDNIASVHRTPDEYRLENRNLEEQVQQINRQLTQ